jgi:hypothetical protein
VVAGEALILWLVTPVMWLAVRGDGGQYPKFKRNGGICDSNDA